MTDKHINFNINYKKMTVFREYTPKNVAYPIVLSSPHSGQFLPEEFIANSRLNIDELRSSEDCFVEDIFTSATDNGIPMIAMNVSRAFIDVNRDKIEIDESMYFDYPKSNTQLGSRRCRVGLGVIPRIVSQNNAIYDGLISFDEAQKRIKNIYDPYHKKLKQMVDKCVKKFGYCLLIDCHSMPSSICKIMDEAKPVDFCISNLFDQSCPTEFFEFLAASLTNKGYRVEYNRPYSGGFITFNYCQPRKNIYTLQIEINRSLYMKENVYKKISEFQTISSEISNSLTALGNFILDFKK